MKHTLYVASILLTFLLSVTSISFTSANAQTSSSSTFSVKGRLTNPDGSAIADGSHTIAASVYQDGSATPIYTETDAVTTAHGVFCLVLGAGAIGSQKLKLSANSSYRLGLSVDGGAHSALSGRFVSLEANERLSKLRADHIKTFVAEGVREDKIAFSSGSGASSPAVKEQTDVSAPEIQTDLTGPAHSH